MIRNELKDYVWNKAQKVRGKDPRFYRQDKFGSLMFYKNYGKNMPTGWELDHSRPRAKGGTNHLNNFQALNFGTNRTKGIKHPYRQVSGVTPNHSNTKQKNSGWGIFTLGVLALMLMK